MMENSNTNQLSQAFVQNLKAKNNIVSIVSKYMQLEKKGRNFWGCCPFHHEKTPSFCINEYDGFYHCFGCGESGDVITFLQKYENISYMEALQILAGNANIELPKFQNDEKYIQAKKRKERLLTILAIAREMYKANILKPEAKLAQDYIRSRKVGRTGLENFELGYSRDPFEIVHILRGKGFTDEEMKASGVCEISKSGKPYDFLSERLVFPIVNTQNDCIGFSGRDLKNSDIMKYKNTAATIVFDKSRTVYAINLIKKLKQTQPLDKVIIVEGQFDVISMHEAGFKNTVACLGTAFTKEHIKEINRFVDKIVLCFDGDSAGQKAILRALSTFEEYGDSVEVKVVRLPNNNDPDEFIKIYGAEKLQKLIDNAVAPTQFKINNLKENFNIENAQERVKFSKEALKVISGLSSSAERDVYIGILSGITGISADVLRRDVEYLLGGKETRQDVETETREEVSQTEENTLNATIKAERFIVASHLHHKEYATYDLQLLEYLQNPSLKKLYKIILDKYAQKEPFIVSSVYDEFNRDIETNINEVINFNFEVITNPQNYYQTCVNYITEDAIKFKISQLSKQYSNETDTQVRKNIINEINQLNIKLRNKNLRGK